MSRKIKNIDHELCDYDEAYDRESASDIGWCGKCKIPECPYNKDLNEKRRMGWENLTKRYLERCDKNVQKKSKMDLLERARNKAV